MDPVTSVSSFTRAFARALQDRDEKSTCCEATATSCDATSASTSALNPTWPGSPATAATPHLWPGQGHMLEERKAPMDQERDSATVTNGFVPVIDLSGRHSAHGRAVLARAIGEACARSGFFTIVGHGVPHRLVDRMHTTTNAFFRLPDVAKELVASGPEVSGFRSSGGTTAQSLDQQSPPDLCEAFGIHVTGDLSASERADLGDYWAPWKLVNAWPSVPAEFTATWREYMSAMTELCADLVRLFALALDLEEGFFDDRFDRHVSSLTANYYFPQLRRPRPGQLRRGPHTDFGALTVLYQEDDLTGLQVHTGAGRWRDVPAVPGSFVVNIGDLMAHWSGGCWVSTLHQVINPESGDTSSRLSIPFFYQPNHDAPTDPVRPLGTPHEAQPHGTTAGEWIATKMLKLFAPPS